MEYLIWLVLIVAVGGVIWWKRNEGGPSAEEQKKIDNLLHARANSPLNQRLETHGYNGEQNRPRKRPVPPSPPPMRTSGNVWKPSAGRSASSYESTPVRQDNSNDLLLGMGIGYLLGDAGGDDKPSPTPTPVSDPIPAPENAPRASETVTDFSSTTDYPSSSSTNSDSGWSSNDRSDSGWSSSSSDSSSSYDSGSSSSSDSSSW